METLSKVSENVFNVSWSVNYTKWTGIKHIDFYIDAGTNFSCVLPTHLQIWEKNLAEEFTELACKGLFYKPWGQLSIPSWIINYL